MSKTPEELARLYADKKHNYNPNFPRDVQHNYDIWWDSHEDFLAGYKAAQAIVEEEIQAVQAQRVERPGLGSAEYALKNVLAKMGGK